MKKLRSIVPLSTCLCLCLSACKEEQAQTPAKAKVTAQEERVRAEASAQAAAGYLELKAARDEVEADKGVVAFMETQVRVAEPGDLQEQAKANLFKAKETLKASEERLERMQGGKTGENKP